ncbi:hypothetical protein TraAM80_09713 [Trypanosoma rangeli]|uniref:Uncharacterized protein n=1 Tax=Trypanosoma rangeli TaxID=5698 RepID=A0A422MTZ6_TRYRA|nr:uncharacterized protein TraAM80_09713 [Trypanosoma rangeli]RNE96639.1 hypothetical protein TraAM80_09713 [Trypanosoma rangeli]|eukprot:RNE96639.1 hypothetical protein TraAM80_09713 [Trypanosoma rangeli]
MQKIVWCSLGGGAVAAEWGCRFCSCSGEYAAALFLLVASGENVPASEKLRVPPPRRLKEAEVSAAAFAGCAPCGPVAWQKFPRGIYVHCATCWVQRMFASRGTMRRCPSSFLRVNEEATGALLLRTSASCSTKCHCNEAVNFTVSG